MWLGNIVQLLFDADEHLKGVKQWKTAENGHYHRKVVVPIF